MTDVKNEFVINLSIDREEIRSAMESVLRGVVKSMDESSERDQARSGDQGPCQRVRQFSCKPPYSFATMPGGGHGVRRGEDASRPVDV